MSTFCARVYVTLKPTVNDPQGNTVLFGLQTLGFDNVLSVRVGKYLEVKVNAKDETTAKETVEKMCRQLLANPVIEEYRVEINSS